MLTIIFCISFFDHLQSHFHHHLRLFLNPFTVSCVIASNLLYAPKHPVFRAKIGPNLLYAFVLAITHFFFFASIF